MADTPEDTNPETPVIPPIRTLSPAEQCLADLNEVLARHGMVLTPTIQLGPRAAPAAPQVDPDAEPSKVAP